MKVLGIVVTYNGSIWIKKCLGSLTKSTLPIDIIVIDNQSADDTVNIIEQNFPEVTLIKSKENLGFGKANNIGLKKVLEENYDFAFLLNQDAWIEPQTIQKLAEVLMANPEYGILSPVHLNKEKSKLDTKFALYICRNNDKSILSDLWLKPKEVYSVYPIDFVNAAAWLISRKCIEIVGGFDPIFPHYGEDNDYISRAWYHGFNVGFVPETFIVHDREGYLKQTDMRKSLAKQYIDRLKLLKNIQSPFGKTLFSILKKEVYYAISFLVKLDIRMFFIKVQLMKRILLQTKAIQKSRQYCINNHAAYLT